MANLTITLKVKKDGFKNIEDLFKKIENIPKKIASLNSEISENSGIPKITVQTKKLEESIGKISNAINDVNKNIEGAAGIFKNETKDIADSSIFRATEKLNIGIETILSRALAFTGAIVGIKFALNDIGAIGNFIVNVLPLKLNSHLELVQQNADLARVGFSAITSSLLDVGPLLNAVVASTKQFAGGILALVAGKFIFSEISILLRRITGNGTENLTILERITRLVTFLDESFNRAFISAGSFLKVVTFGVATGFSPLLGGIPLINSLVDVFLARSRKAKDLVSKFFGDSRANFIILIQEARKLLTLAVGAFGKSAESLNSFSKNAEIANKRLTVFGSNDTFKILTMRKLPISFQIQLLFSEIKTVLFSFSRQIETIKQTILFAFVETEDGVRNIENKATKATSKLKKDVQGSTDNLVAFSERGFFKRIVSFPVTIGQNFVFAGKKIKEATSTARKFAKSITSVTFSAPKNLAKLFLKPFDKGADFLVNGPNKKTVNENKPNKNIKELAQDSSDFRTHIARSSIHLQDSKKILTDIQGIMKKMLTVVSELTTKLDEIISKPIENAQTKINKAKKDVTSLIGEFVKLTDAGSVKPGLVSLTRTSPNSIGRNAPGLLKNSISNLGTASKIGKVGTINNDNNFQQLKKISVLINSFSEAGIKPISDLLKNVDKFKEPKNLAKANRDISELVKTVDRVKNVDIKSFKFTGFGQRVISQLNSAFDAGEKGTARFKKIIQQYNQVLINFLPEKEIQIQGKKTGEQIAQGLEKSKSIVKKAADEIAETVRDDFPNSPVKTGPLKNIYRSGFKIVEFIASGMKQGKGLIAKSSNSIAEIIAKHFPRSPVAIGALIGIAFAGRKIVKFIADGMSGSQNLVVRSAGKIASSIFSTIRDITVITASITGANIAKSLVTGTVKGFSTAKNALQGTINAFTQRISDIANIGEQSSRFGVSTEVFSALDNSLKSVGANASELSLIFSRTNEAINGGSKEAKESLQELGIGIQDIAKKENPAIAVLLRVSDIVKNTKQGSKEATKALRALGITANSNIVNFLQKGSVKIKELINDSAKIGAVLGREFVKSAQDLRKFNVAISAVKQNLFDSLLRGIVPELNKVTPKIIEFIKKHQKNINAFLITTGRVMAAVIQTLVSFFVLLTQEPTKALDILKKSLLSFAKLAIGVLGTLLKSALGQILEFLSSSTNAGIKKVFTTLIEFGKKANFFVTQLIKSTSSTALNATLANLKKITILLTIKIVDFMGTIPGIVFNVLKFIFVKMPVVLAEGVSEVISFLGRQIIKGFTSIIVLAEEKLPFANKFFSLFGLGKKEIAELRNFVIAGGDDIDGVISGVIEGIENVAAAFGDLKGTYKNASKEAEKANADFLKGFNEVIEATKNKFSEINEGELDVGVLDEITIKFKNFMGEFEDTIKGTPIAAEFQKVIDAMSNANFDKVEQGLDKIQQRVTEGVVLEKSKDGPIFSDEALKKQEKALELFLNKVRARTSEDFELRKDIELAELDAKHAQELIKVEEFSLGKTALEIKETKNKLREIQAIERQQEVEKLQREFLQSQVEQSAQLAGGLANTLNTISDISKGHIKELFLASKAAAIAQGTIDIASAFMKTLGAQGAFGIASAGLAVAAATAKLGTIIATTIGFADGGLITQGTGPRSDDVMARLSRGEFVIPADRVAAFSPRFFEGIRTGTITPEKLMGNIAGSLPSAVRAPSVPSFNAGGLVNPSPTAESAAPKVEVVNANFIDPSLFANFMATQQGKRIVLNILRDEPEQLKSILAN